MKRITYGACLLAVCVAVVSLTGFMERSNLYSHDLNKDSHVEARGQRNVNYMVNDIDKIKKPYNYVIGKSTPLVLDILGVLAVIGAIGFGFVHGFGRYMAHKNNPLEIEEAGREFIYKKQVRVGHLVHALSVLALMVSGFIMHFSSPSNPLGYIHNAAEIVLVVTYVFFILHEIVTFDIRHYISQDLELKEGIVKQAIFYIWGIFKREEHPYHMDSENRLTPLQKIAYFGIMFGLMPLVIVTGIILLKPSALSFIVRFIGMENMKYVLMAHLIGAFGSVAFLIGHIYLGTTGVTIKQHFEVMVTGFHRNYRAKRGSQA